MREGWRESTVTDALVLQNGYPFKPKDLGEEGTPVVRIKQLYNEHEVLDHSSIEVPERFHIVSGDIIFSWSGRVDALQWSRGPAYLNQHLFKVTPQANSGVLSRYALFQLQHIAPRLHLHGTTMKHVTKKELSRSSFTIPPLREQKRIVDLMDSVDVAIRAARAEVDATETLREQVLASELGTTGRDWKETTLGGLETQNQGTIQTGPFGSQLHKSDYSEEGVPVVMPTNIRRLRIDPEGIKRVSDSHVSRLQRHALRVGDIVYSRRGDVEKCALIGPSEQGWLCGTGCLLVRVGGETLNPEWLGHYLSTAAVRRWISNHAVGATMPNLNTKILRGVPVSLPSRAEQDRLVQTMAALNAAADACFEALDRLRDLRSSMLSVLLSGEHEIPESYDQFLDLSEVVQAG